RIDALTRDFDPFGEILLAPVPLGAEDAETVFHQQPPSPSISLLAIPPTAWPKYQTTTIQYPSMCRPVRSRRGSPRPSRNSARSPWPKASGAPGASAHI